jgi:hypothetical protein
LGSNPPIAIETKMKAVLFYAMDVLTLLHVHNFQENKINFQQSPFHEIRRASIEVLLTTSITKAEAIKTRSKNIAAYSKQNCDNT